MADLAQLVARCRHLSGDKVAPYFWSDDDWRDFLNEAQDEAAIRARLFEDDQIEVEAAAGDPYLDYPAKVWSVQRVFLDGRQLDLVDRQMLDSQEGEAWEEATGAPRAAYEVNGQLRLYPTPETKLAGRMVAFCTAERRMVEPSDKPALRIERQHILLVDWALHLAFSVEDADAFDPAKADKHAALFEAHFGPRPDERKLRRQRINVRRAVAGHYF